MFHNLGSGHFEKSSDALGADFIKPVAARGLATADFFNEGAVGFAVNCRGVSPRFCATTAQPRIIGSKCC